jgi:hypothetical protein
MATRGAVLAESMACGLVVGRLWESRVVLSGVSMHHWVLSRHYMKDLSLHACAIDIFFLISSRSYVVMWKFSLGFS